MQSVLHIERVDSAPGTPASNPGQEFRSSPSRQRFSLDALMSPLKSFRSRRKLHISDNQSPKTVKHERSLFSLFNTARTQTPDSPEVFKVGTAVKRPKTVAPSKNNLRDNDYVPAQPKRSKSLGDILGTITTRVSSKYNTVTRRSQGQAGINHNSVPDSGIGCVTGNAERVTASTRQKWRIQDIESEMSAFWRLEQVMDSPKNDEIKNSLGLKRDSRSSNSSWESAAETLYNAEGAIIDRATPKNEEEENVTITPGLNSGFLSLSSKTAPIASYGEKYYITGSPSSNNNLPNKPEESHSCKEKGKDDVQPVIQHDFHISDAQVWSGSNRRNIDSALCHRLDMKSLAPQLSDFKRSTNITEGASIAERIQLTVDEMTKTRYMNPAVYNWGPRFNDPLIDDPDYISTLPDTAYTGLSSAVTIPRDSSGSQVRITRKDTATFDSHQLVEGPGIACSKTRVEGKKARPCSQRSRQVSTAPVRVKFPDTTISTAYVGTYESSSKAISDIFERNHGQLSSVCAYDRENRTIHVYPVEWAPNSNEVRQRGLEAIWLPFQDKSGSEALLDVMLSDELLFQTHRLSGSTNASKINDHMEMQTKLSTPRCAGSSSRMNIIQSGSDRAKTESTPISRRSPQPTHIREQSDSEDNSVFLAECSSELGNSILRRPSGSSEAYYNIATNPKRYFRDPDLRKSPLWSDIEPEMHKTNGKRYHKSVSVDEWRKLRPLREKTPCSQWPYYIKTAEVASDAHCDWGHSCNANKQQSIENTMYLSLCTTEELNVSAQQSDSLFPNHKPQSNIASGGEEENVDIPTANGFQVTAYAAQLLETGGRRASGDYSDSVSNDENQKQTIHRSGSGSISQKDSKIGQLNTSPTTRHIHESQSASASLELRHRPSNFAKVLQDIDEAGESDSKKCFAGRPARSPDCSAGKQTKFANGDRAPDHTMPASVNKSSCDCTRSDRSSSPLVSNERKKIAGLVQIFQARGMMGLGLIPGLESPPKLDKAVDQCNGCSLDSSTRIINPSGEVYCPSHDSNLSDASTETSSMFGERLERFEMAAAKSSEDEQREQREENEEREERENDVRDSLIYG